MTNIAEKILMLYKQMNIREDEMLLPEVLCNMISFEQSEIHEGVSELKKSGYLREGNHKLFLTKKGFDYINSDIK